MDRVEFEHEFETDDGNIIILYVSMEYRRYLEPNYGADADGRRGVSRWFVNTRPICITNKDGFDVTELIKQSKQDLYKELEEIANTMADDADGDPD